MRHAGALGPQCPPGRGGGLQLAHPCAHRERAAAPGGRAARAPPVAARRRRARSGARAPAGISHREYPPRAPSASAPGRVCRAPPSRR
ncbi:MAG: hypothetical protein COV75_01425, partial [Candidatus Omnitrophica bacterium CG11_big_fil_rev_8_21_14_0_20_63_9]